MSYTQKIRPTEVSGCREGSGGFTYLSVDNTSVGFFDMKEEWRDVVGYEGYYQVSNLGQVRSVKRPVFCAGKFVRTTNEKILKTSNDEYGYERVEMNVNKERVIRLVHRLVAMAFIDGAVGGDEINHIDGNKSNNTPQNLEWTTRSENMKHAFRVGLIKPMVGSKNPKSKRVIQLSMDGILLNEFECAMGAYRWTGISFGNICSVCRGERNHAGGFKWRYI